MAPALAASAGAGAFGVHSPLPLAEGSTLLPSKDRGAAAVELALVLPFLLLIVLGVVDFGRAYNAQIELTSAARESARIWALGGSQSDATDRASQAAPGLTVAKVAFSDPSCPFGTTATVTVTASFEYITPFIAELAPTVKYLNAKGVMRCGG